MGKALLKLSEEEICQRFLAYLKQRGVVDLKQFCVALGFMPHRVEGGGKRKDRTSLIRHLDALVTPLLASPECRVETGAGTAFSTVRYYAQPPKPAFVPGQPRSITTYVDPDLRGSWRPEDDRRLARRRFFEDWTKEANQRRRAEHVSLVQPSPPTPLPPGRGEQEDGDETTTTTEMTEMARTKEQCIAALDQVLADLPSLDEAELSLGGILRAGGFSTAWFTNNPDQHRKAKAALERERTRRWREAQETSPPSPLSQAGEGGQEPEPEPEQEALVADVREDYERQIREMREELAEVARRNAELEAQAMVLERRATDPAEALMVRRVELERQIVQIQTQMEQLANVRLARLEDLRAIAHAMALLEGESSPPSPLSQEGEGEPEDRGEITITEELA